jgi:hypothetical protein
MGHIHYTSLFDLLQTMLLFQVFHEFLQIFSLILTLLPQKFDLDAKNRFRNTFKKLSSLTNQHLLLYPVYFLCPFQLRIF